MADKNLSQVSLVLQLSEAFTGEPIDGRVTITDVFGVKPLHKRGGFYVFTGAAPKQVRISSDIYCDTESEIIGDRVRLQLVQRCKWWNHGVTGCRIKVKQEETIHLYAGTRSYKLNADISPGDTRLSLYKTDFDDITWLNHAPRMRDGSFGKPFLITGGLEGSVFTIDGAFTEDLTRSGCAIAPLCTLIADTGGELTFPLPEGASSLFVFRDNSVAELAIKQGELNIFNLED